MPWGLGSQQRSLESHAEKYGCWSRIPESTNRDKPGADPGILKRGGQFEENFTMSKKRQQFFLMPSQCSFSDHGLIDDSMTYIVAGDSRNGWNHLAASASKVYN